MAKRALGSLIVVLAIAGGIVWIYHGRSDASSNLTLFNALGTGAAEETAKLLANSGQVMVIMPEASVKNPVFEGELKCFQKTLKKSGVSVASTVKFKLTPLELIEAGGMVPRDQFLNALQGQAKVGAIVLFCGFPELTVQDYNTVKRSGTKVVVVSAYQPAFRKLLKSRVIDLAIVPRFDRSAATAKKAQTPRKLFESEFMVLTVDNVEIVTEYH